jgi:uncharacterized membrane protein YphA (DoxX/SURF4 family)
MNMINFYKNVSLMGGFLPVVHQGRGKILNRRKVGTAWCAAATDNGSLNAAG